MVIIVARLESVRRVQRNERRITAESKQVSLIFCSFFLFIASPASIPKSGWIELTPRYSANHLRPATGIERRHFWCATPWKILQWLGQALVIDILWAQQRHIHQTLRRFWKEIVFFQKRPLVSNASFTHLHQDLALIAAMVNGLAGSLRAGHSNSKSFLHWRIASYRLFNMQSTPLFSKSCSIWALWFWQLNSSRNLTPFSTTFKLCSSSLLKQDSMLSARLVKEGWTAIRFGQYLWTWLNLTRFNGKSYFMLTFRRTLSNCSKSM